MVRLNRKTLKASVLISRPPEEVFAFLRCASNLGQWSQLRNVTAVGSGLYQAEDAGGICCCFLWTEDAARKRIIFQQTGHKDRPCLVVSVSASHGISQVESQYTSSTLEPGQERDLVRQMTNLKQVLES